MKYLAPTTLKANSDQSMYELTKNFAIINTDNKDDSNFIQEKALFLEKYKIGHVVGVGLHFTRKHGRIKKMLTQSAQTSQMR